MTELMTSTPVVMTIASHDPSGGAGISAAIETLASLGCHCTPIISKLAARDTASLKDSQITDTGLLIEQIRAVLEDISVDLFCIGDLASIGNAEAMYTILNDYPDIPLLLQPAMPQHDGEHGLDTAIRSLLLPRATITVLSKDKALTLAPSADTLTACAQELMEYGCDNLLVTGDKSDSGQHTNHWFSPRGSQSYHWQQLPHSFHGATSTLTAALSGYLAHGLSMAESIQQAQQFTHQALEKGRRLGMGKLLPDRMHWCRN